MKNYYQILNISPEASMKDVHDAYKNMYTKHHPDRKGGRTKENLAYLREIKEAYNVLGDYHQRHQYDNERENNFQLSRNKPFDMFGLFNGMFNDINMDTDRMIQELPMSQQQSYMMSSVTQYDPKTHGYKTEATTQINNNGQVKAYKEHIVTDSQGNVIKTNKTPIKNNQSAKASGARSNKTSIRNGTKQIPSSQDVSRRLQKRKGQ